MSDTPAPRKGEAIITISNEAGEPEEYLVRYNFRNLIQLQKQFKTSGRGILDAFTILDFEIIAGVIHAGIVAGKSWPERFGKKPPTPTEIQDSLSFDEFEQYTKAIFTALRGAGFMEESSDEDGDEEKKTED